MSRLFTINTQDSVVISPAASINTLAKRTQMVWMKLVSYGTGEDPIAWFQRNGAHEAGYVGDGIVFDAHAIYIDYDPTDADSDDAAPGDAPQLADWIHVAFTHDSTTDKKTYIFVNGVEIAAYSVQDAGSTALADDSGSAINVGSYGGTPAFTVDGRLYDFRLYDSILTSAELAMIVAGGRTVDPQPTHNKCQLTFATDQGLTEPDASGNNNIGAITGATFSSDNPIFAGPVTVGAVFPGPYRGDTFQEAFSNRSNQDILQIVNQGGAVIWNLDADGIATDNPVFSTTNAVLARLQAETFVEAFRNPYQLNILQVVGPGGAIIFYVDSDGNAATP